MFIYSTLLSNGIYYLGVCNIGKFRVLEDSLKKSFSNVRMDIVSIKDYLEKQHDMLNTEIGELQSQIISLQKGMAEKVRETDEHATKDDLKLGLEEQKDLFRDLVKQNREIEGKLSSYEKLLVRLQSEKAGSDELAQKEAEISKETREVRNELYTEIESIDRKFKDTKLRMSEEQEKNYSQKMKRLEKGLADVEDLKKELRELVREGRKKGLSEERLKRVERKTQKSGWARFWDGVSDFLFEEEPLEETEEKTVVIQKAEKPKKRPAKQESNIWQWIMVLIVVMAICGALYLVLSGKLAPLTAGIAALFNRNATNPVEVVPEEIELNEPVITVYEGDFVDISPNVSDPEGDNISYTFSLPLNSSGQWQTEKGDVGIYPVSVIVFDGSSETKLEFTIVVKAKQ